jgi:hypothetical protein
MGRGTAAAITVCLLGASTPAAGNQFLSGNDLLQLCDTDYAQCDGYVEGVIDHLEASRANERLSPCVPIGTDGEQAKNVVVKYMKDHPQMRKEPAWAVVDIAVVTAWNCGL